MTSMKRFLQTNSHVLLTYTKKINKKQKEFCKYKKYKLEKSSNK